MLKLDIPGFLSETLTEALLGLSYNFVAYYLDVKGKIPMLKGKINGTVLSGHPT